MSSFSGNLEIGVFSHSQFQRKNSNAKQYLGVSDNRFVASKTKMHFSQFVMLVCFMSLLLGILFGLCDDNVCVLGALTEVFKKQ